MWRRYLYDTGKGVGIRHKNSKVVFSSQEWYQYLLMYVKIMYLVITVIVFHKIFKETGQNMNGFEARGGPK